MPLIQPRTGHQEFPGISNSFPGSQEQLTRVKTPSCVPSFSSSYSYIAEVDVADLFLVEAVLISTRERCILTVMTSLISPRGHCILSDDVIVL